jgi:hypothetical protein
VQDEWEAKAKLANDELVKLEDLNQEKERKKNK